MFSIGEFSKITGLTVKTLRFYHEEALLVPASVDPSSGYRYYAESQIETARVITYLRSLEFPLAEIKEILRQGGDGDVLEAIEKQKALLDAKIKHLKKAVRSLNEFIAEEKGARKMAETKTDVQEKTLAPLLVAGVRMKGRYDECGLGFKKIGRSMGRYIRGKPMLLHYDHEYKEENADFEACFPVSQAKAVDGISVRELPGGCCVSLMHIGPYDELGRSYAKIFGYIKQRGYCALSPTREIYIKGPGMIFKGNPKKYVTEIEILVEPATAGA